MYLLVKRLSPTAKLPTRGSALSVGADLYADIPSEIYLESGSQVIIPTGIAASPPDGCYMQIAPRSGLAASHGLQVLGGIIDPDYTGEIKVILRASLSYKNKLCIAPCSRIAQLLCIQAEIVPVYEVDELPTTSRGSRGFGSTGA